jgi:hypothetical protein
MTDFEKVLEECLRELANDTSTVDECLARYPHYAKQLRPLLRTVLFMNLGRNVKPAPAFEARTRASLTRHMRSHPRPARNLPLFPRLALTLAILVMALLITGTAYAQSSLPGDQLYGWKRTSEQIWRALSLDPLATDIAIAHRRLHEWLAVADDPARSDEARKNYFEALGKLKSVADAESLIRVLPALQSQQDVLQDAGLTSPELETIVTEVTGLIAAEGTAETVPTVEILPQPTPTLEPSSEPTHVIESTPTLEPTNLPSPTIESTPTLEPTIALPPTIESTPTLEPTNPPSPTLEDTPTVEPTNPPPPTLEDTPTAEPTVQPTPEE